MKHYDVSSSCEIVFLSSGIEFENEWKGKKREDMRRAKKEEKEKRSESEYNTVQCCVFLVRLRLTQAGVQERESDEVKFYTERVRRRKSIGTQTMKAKWVREQVCEYEKGTRGEQWTERIHKSVHQKKRDKQGGRETTQKTLKRAEPSFIVVNSRIAQAERKRERETSTSNHTQTPSISVMCVWREIERE